MPRCYFPAGGTRSWDDPFLDGSKGTARPARLGRPWAIAAATNCQQLQPQAIVAYGSSNDLSWHIQIVVVSDSSAIIPCGTDWSALWRPDFSLGARKGACNSALPLFLPELAPGQAWRQWRALSTPPNAAKVARTLPLTLAHVARACLPFLFWNNFKFGQASSWDTSLELVLQENKSEMSKICRVSWFSLKLAKITQKYF